MAVTSFLQPRKSLTMKNRRKIRIVFLLRWWYCLGVSSIVVCVVDSFSSTVVVGSKHKFRHEQLLPRFVNKLLPRFIDANDNNNNNNHHHHHHHNVSFVSRDGRNTTTSTTTTGGVYRRIEDWHDESNDPFHVIKHLKREKAKWAKTFEDGGDGI
jgi:hypothetical protein